MSRYEAEKLYIADPDLRALIFQIETQWEAYVAQRQAVFALVIGTPERRKAEEALANRARELIAGAPDFRRAKFWNRCAPHTVQCERGAVIPWLDFCTTRAQVNDVVVLSPVGSAARTLAEEYLARFLA